ncbi:von Willebrand factor A domain-containing protein 3B [Camelus ferus]|nr:von Willebrand factor A domain-containing protein 3B [Camelus ferus]
MEIPGSSSTISEQQQRERREGLSDTRKDLAKQSLISSEEWLQLHGLKSNKLTLKQVLSQIGFPHCEEYVTSLGRPVASRYADGLFPRTCRTEDGRVYNLTAKSELLHQFVEHLTQAVERYKQRMDWLTSESRQIFGVILEQCIAIVLDFGNMLEEELNLCRDALIMVLQEQVAHIAKFNIIWVSQEPVKWQENAVPVTEQSLAAAISWIEKLPFALAVSQTSHLDALLEAGKDESVSLSSSFEVEIESIYYFVVGDIPEESKELLLQRALETPHPVCTVSFNARGEGTIAFLKDLSAKTRSRFHAFAERTECVEFPASPAKDGDSAITWNSRKLKGKLPPGSDSPVGPRFAFGSSLRYFGSSDVELGSHCIVVPGAGVREDVFLIWREMEEASSMLAQIQRLVAEPPKTDMATADRGATSVENESNPEDTWDSEKWLQKYGLKAQKLSFYDVIADCAFRHADGVVDIKAKPEDESLQTSAETNKKTVHAKYCSRFVHAPWKDGSLVHVCITKEKCMWYSERIHVVLARIQRRIKWLQDGSQLLFGKVRSDCVYILIDTSHSMKAKLELVKDKIIQLIQEQLKYKRKFNFVQFDAQAIAWREKLVEINEDTLKGAQAWVRDMKIGSSTNTLNALQIAFADKETQVIYLLTDGRPDQNEDLTLLIKEMEQGCSDLEKVQDLYSESLVMDWWYNGEKDGDRTNQNQPAQKSDVCP